jgi:hypothetical protein
MGTLGGLQTLRRRFLDHDRRSFGKPRRPDHRGSVAALGVPRHQSPVSSNPKRATRRPPG